KDWTNREVLLRIDPAHLTGAIVEIVVAIESLPLFGSGQSALGPQVGRKVLRLRRFGRSKGAEALFGIDLRAVEALLFARPESDANRPPRLDVQGFEDANDFHRHHRSSAVIRRAGPG